jgi:transcription elongation factor GreB
MSKAFTREDDDIPERPWPPRPVSSLPPGAKNYLTPDGAQRLREELERLTRELRQTSNDPAARDSRASLEQRIAQVQHGLATAVVVPPPGPHEDRVRFGAMVTVQDRLGARTQYRIVGADETDVDRGWVSWFSPIAKALLNARPGQKVRLRLPTGEEELEIVGFSYEPHL